MSKKGIFIQEVFPLGAFGPRQWSRSEMGRLFRWLKSLGYSDAALGGWPFFRREEDGHTLLELGAMYHSGLNRLASFEPGFAYAPEDRYLGTEEGLARAEFFRDQARLAREAGLRAWLTVFMTLGAPGYLEDHPELAAVNGSEVFMEGSGFCPSRPEGLKHLLEFHGRQVRYLDAVEGYILFSRDPGGCSCRLCTPQPTMMTRVANAFYRMIREHRLQAPVAFLSWHVKAGEVPELAAGLPKDVTVCESPRIHALDSPREEFVARVKEWTRHGRCVEGWLETQENPTTLLPTVYPRRVADTVALMKELGIRDLWQTSTQNPYLFPLNFWMAPKLWEGVDDLESLQRRFISESYGVRNVEAGLRYLSATELAWEMVQRESHYQAGFIGLFVITFPNRMLPERMMREGVPDAIRRDLAEAEHRAEEALKAAEEFADGIREFHTLDANIVVVSAEVFYHRVRMRSGKVPVLDAIHRGDGEEAVRAWTKVRGACDDMVAAAKSAPNTDVLVHHWRRFELLPDRLKALGQHLAELADRKSFRPIIQALYIGNLYGEDRKK